MTCRVYRNPNCDSRISYPYLLELQHAHMAVLETRLVAPVVQLTDAEIPGIPGLTPKIRVKGELHHVLIPMMASIPRSMLGLEESDVVLDRFEIQSSLDRLLTGF